MVRKRGLIGFAPQIEVRQAEREGADDGRSATRGLLSAIERASGLTRGVARTYLCSGGRVDHYASSFGDRGWGCGYRNLQGHLPMLALIYNFIY